MLAANGGLVSAQDEALAAAEEGLAGEGEMEGAEPGQVAYLPVPGAGSA